MRRINTVCSLRYRTTKRPAPWRRAPSQRKADRRHQRYGQRLPRHLGLVVGNGLALDLHQSQPGLKSWNPSNPLRWDIRAPGHPDRQLLDYLPRFREQIDLARDGTRAVPDFEIFRKVAEGLACRNDFDSCVTVAEMRHFLAIAYSAFQLEVDKLDLISWPWQQFLRSLSKRLTVVVSFNYELVLERLL